MRSKKNIETTVLQSGETLEKSFDNYVEMAEHAVDWTLFCSYQLKANFSEGIYKILQLPSMQIAYTNMEGGIMFDFVVPKDCITLSLMKDISQKACIWGFRHLGRFSKFYTELFRENPSITLKKPSPLIDRIHSDCVERKEEIFLSTD
jgi:hypothetical protein